jgi:membrane-associated protease RseP (regulator of RpoE activity)
MTLGVLGFVVALLVSVMLHEAGHFLTARRFGMKATQFFFGFGPTLWSIRRGETEYGFKAIPAGGFVKIVGMTPLEEVEPGDESRVFYKQPAPQRAVVLAAGSFMHFVIAFVVLWLIFAVVGQSKVSTTIDTVSSCIPATETATCSASDGASPAQTAGLQHGDRILAIDGKRITKWDDFSKALRAKPGGTVSITWLHDGRQVTKEVTLATARRASLDDPNKTETVGVLGVKPGTETVREGPLAAIGRSGDAFGQSVVLSFKGIGAIPAAVPKLLDTLVHGKPRDTNSLTSVVGVARVSGQALQGSEPLAEKITFFLGIVVALNIFVGLFNLLPLLPLDGGHLAILGFEQARSGIYRLLGRRDPGRVDLRKLLPVAYLVLALFVGLSLLLVLADIVNPITNPFTG